MGYPIELEAEVQADGMLHRSVRDAQPGDRMKVVIKREEDEIVIEEGDGKPVRVFGQFKGRGRILPSFYDSIVFPQQ